MNFISNVLDAIPVVGHVKGVVHYAVGDAEGGSKAMYQSTRTSAVLAGGAVGSLAGPAGAVAGAMYAGLATDGVASIAMDKPQGIVESCENVAKDIAFGRNPTGSILSTGVQLGFDAVGGLGMSGVSGAASKISEKAVAKTAESVGKKMAATVGEEMIEKSVQLTAEEMSKLVGKKVAEKAVKQTIQAEALLISAHVGLKASKRTDDEREAEMKKEAEDRCRKQKEQQEKARKEKERQENERKKNENRANEEKTKPTSATGSGSSQPPQKDKDNDKKSKETSDVDYFDIFMKLLRRLLKLIYGTGSEPFTTIFNNLTPGQRQYLAKIIQRLMKDGILDEVVELTIRILKEYLSAEISFPNFLSFLEIVRTYILDELDERTKNSRGTETGRPRMKTKDHRAKILSDIFREKDLAEKIVALLNKLRTEIRAETAPPNNITPDFRDIFAAVYHYLKHRHVPLDGTLTVKEYYDWIRKCLPGLRRTREYTRLLRTSRPPTIRYEVYIVMFNRRFKIAVNVINGKIVLSSAYVISAAHPGDKDGDVFIFEDFK